MKPLDSSATEGSRNHLDLWFSKPTLYLSNTGRWCCRTQPDGQALYVVGNGLTLSEAFEDMKRAVIGYCKHTHGKNAVVEIVRG